MITIIPAILTKNKKFLIQELDRFTGIFDEVQIDITDEEFVPEKTITPVDLPFISKQIKIGAHLMATRPDKMLSTLFRLHLSTIIIHVEISLDLTSLARIIKKQNILSGLAVNPETKIEDIQAVAENFDFIQLMGVKPGSQGRKFAPEILPKILDIRQFFPKPIWIDGGINDTTISLIRDYDIKTVVVGSFLKEGDVKQKLELLKENYEN